MEVHAHTHTERKKWTHFLWEFLMLFLAVFAGFLAENQREHYTEHKRGLQYIKSFVEDLKVDTGSFSGFITLYQKKEADLNNLYLCYDTINKKLKSTTCIKNIYVSTIGYQDLIYTDRTLQQLKNAGGLRLIAEQDADSIIKYDQHLRYLLKVESTSLQEMQTRVRNTRNSVFAYSEIMETEWQRGAQPETVNLISTDKELLNRFFNEVMVYRFACRFQFRQLMKLKENAVRLIHFYSQKYHLK